MYEPGTKTLYSDVDYMLLDFVIEQLTGSRLDDYLAQVFWQPMGLTHITYQPLQHGFSPNDCAATELNGNTGTALFPLPASAPTRCKAKCTTKRHTMPWAAYPAMPACLPMLPTWRCWLRSCCRAAMAAIGFSAAMCWDTFTSPKIESAANWGLGWWREATWPRPLVFGTQSSSGTFGHQGWTGTPFSDRPCRAAGHRLLDQ